MGYGNVPEVFKKPLEIVDRNRTALLNLRNELLDAQKLNSRHIEYDFKPVVIGDLIKEICINIWGIANELKIQIFFDTDLKTSIIEDVGGIKNNYKCSF